MLKALVVVLLHCILDEGDGRSSVKQILFYLLNFFKQVKTCIATLYDKLKETKTFSLLRSKAA